MEFATAQSKYAWLLNAKFSLNKFYTPMYTNE
jgi:hypothetical protein